MSAWPPPVPCHIAYEPSGEHGYGPRTLHVTVGILGPARCARRLSGTSVGSGGLHAPAWPPSASDLDGRLCPACFDFRDQGSLLDVLAELEA